MKKKVGAKILFKKGNQKNEMKMSLDKNKFFHKLQKSIF